MKVRARIKAGSSCVYMVKVPFCRVLFRVFFLLPVKHVIANDIILATSLSY